MTDWLIYIGACIAVSVSPGPAVMYIVTRTLDQGTAAGLASIAGISLGGIVHVLLAAFGVAAAAAAWPMSLTLLQLFGAGYLIWLGWQRVRDARSPAGKADVDRRQALFAVFRDGIVVNLTNPKTVLFLLAFLPQFADPAAASLPLELLGLGLTFVVVAALTDSVYVATASQVRSRLGTDQPRAWPGYLAGAIYALLGGVGVVDALRQLIHGRFGLNAA